MLHESIAKSMQELRRLLLQEERCQASTVSHAESSNNKECE